MLDLADFGDKIPLLGVTPVAGRGRLQGWAQLRSYRVVAVRADAGLLDVRLQGAPMSAAAGAARIPAAKHDVGELVLAAEWTGRLQDWRVQVSRLRMGHGAGRQIFDCLLYTSRCV